MGWGEGHFLTDWAVLAESLDSVKESLRLPRGPACALTQRRGGRGSRWPRHGPLPAGCGGHSTHRCGHGWRRTRRCRFYCSVPNTHGVGQRGGLQLTRKQFVLKSRGSVGTTRGPLPGKASHALVRHAGASGPWGSREEGARRRRRPQRVRSSWERSVDTLGESPGMSGTQAMAPSSADGAPGQGNLSRGPTELTLHLPLPCGTCLNEWWAQTGRLARVGRPARGGADLAAGSARPCTFRAKDNLQALSVV